VTAGLSVRAAALDDLPAVVELRLALLREYEAHPFYEHLRDDARERAYEMYRAQLASPYESIWLAERGAQYVGILRCVESHSSPLLQPEQYCYVSSVYVVPSERRRGVLRALLTAAERWCDERGIREMRLNNSTRSPTARDAWQSLGFEVVEEVRRRPIHATDASLAGGHTRAGVR
jgi:GNAT superfamily N-acetyltransferase